MHVSGINLFVRVRVLYDHHPFFSSPPGFTTHFFSTTHDSDPRPESAEYRITFFNLDCLRLPLIINESRYEYPTRRYLLYMYLLLFQTHYTEF